MNKPEIIRFPSRDVDIGGIPVGARHPVRLQSMTNTRTTDVKATLEQCIKTFDAGADYMRISVPDKASLAGLKELKKKLRAAGYHQPLVADIHFRASLALEAAKVVEKVRINPGNYTPAHPTKKEWTTADLQAEMEAIRNKLRPLVMICQDYGTAIRIGTNAGSLSARLIDQYGHTPQALAISTMEYVNILEELHFRQMVLSLKASDPVTTIRAYHLLAKMMLEANKCYPLHTGVTEAGGGISGRIRSALGVIPLLQQGIGDTLRISLTEKPENEILFLRELIRPFRNPTTEPVSNTAYTLEDFREAATPPPLLPGGMKANVFTEESLSNSLAEGFGQCHLSTWPDRLWKETLANHPTGNMVVTLGKGFPWNSLSTIYEDLRQEGIEAAVIAQLSMEEAETDQLIIRLTKDFGSLVLQKKIQGFVVADDRKGEIMAGLALELLQAAGLHFSKTGFISCPGCARTSFDIEGVLHTLKEELPDRPGLTIAVMGCVVNGPGEMAGADYGLLGQSNGKLQVFKEGTAIFKDLSADQAISSLILLVKPPSDNPSV